MSFVLTSHVINRFIQRYQKNFGILYTKDEAKEKLNKFVSMARKVKNPKKEWWQDLGSFTIRQPHFYSYNGWIFVAKFVNGKRVIVTTYFDKKYLNNTIQKEKGLMI